MKQKKNRAFSFLEAIMTVSLTLIVTGILFSLIFSMNKSFIKISNNLEKDKEIETFQNIISSHIEYSKSVEHRILDVASNSKIPSFSYIFNKENLVNKGNFLILKFSKLIDVKNKIVEINYRTFFFIENKLEIGYFLEGDIEANGEFSSQNKLISDCNGSFEVKDNFLKISIKNLDKKNIGEKNYEFSLHF